MWPNHFKATIVTILFFSASCGRPDFTYRIDQPSYSANTEPLKMSNYVQIRKQLANVFNDSPGAPTFDYILRYSLEEVRFSFGTNCSHYNSMKFQYPHVVGDCAPLTSPTNVSDSAASIRPLSTVIYAGWIENVCHSLVSQYASMTTVIARVRGMCEQGVHENELCTSTYAGSAYLSMKPPLIADVVCRAAPVGNEIPTRTDIARLLQLFYGDVSFPPELIDYYERIVQEARTEFFPNGEGPLGFSCTGYQIGSPTTQPNPYVQVWQALTLNVCRVPYWAVR